MTTTRTDYSALAWEKRVAELEAEGATTSDAQAVADAEFEMLACNAGNMGAKRP